MDVDQIYASHPLSMASILGRLSRRGGSGATAARPTEWDLAIDPETELTDQNHSGGVQAVLELASAARITAASRVADIGAGLGGSARVLAAALGCEVLAIERDKKRYEDAGALTALVGLAARVNTIAHDAMQGNAGIHSVDVLWGQSAWVHFDSPGRFLDIWLGVLTPDGRVALADSFRAREPRGDAEATLLKDLEHSWGAHLVTVAHWAQQLEMRDFRVEYQDDRSDEAILGFKRLGVVSRRWPPGLRTDFEAAGWQRATAALESGLIQSVRIVAARR